LSVKDVRLLVTFNYFESWVWM